MRRDMPPSSMRGRQLSREAAAQAAAPTAPAPRRDLQKPHWVQKGRSMRRMMRSSFSDSRRRFRTCSSSKSWSVELILDSSLDSRGKKQDECRLRRSKCGCAVTANSGWVQDFECKPQRIGCVMPHNGSAHNLQGSPSSPHRADQVRRQNTTSGLPGEAGVRPRRPFPPRLTPCLVQGLVIRRTPSTSARG